MNSPSVNPGNAIRTILICLAGVVALFAANEWPAYRFWPWFAFSSLIAVMLYRDLKKPINYDSISISGNTIEYSAFGQTTIIQISDIERLLFVREEALFPDLSGPYIESKWVVIMTDGKNIEIMDDWPDRRKLFRTFEKHLPGFDRRAAKAGFRAFKEGIWQCFQPPN